MSRPFGEIDPGETLCPLWLRPASIPTGNPRDDRTEELRRTDAWEETVPQASYDWVDPLVAYYPEYEHAISPGNHFGLIIELLVLFVILPLAFRFKPCSFPPWYRAFSFAYIIFRNPIAVAFTLVGGLLFAWRYSQT